MRLFHIQDADAPMYVVAQDWPSALDAWKRHVASENSCAPDTLDEPDGIALVCDERELLLP